MCTCLELNFKNHYFGRTLDLDFHYNEEVVITPRNYEFKCPNSLTFKTKYSIIGTAFVNDDYPLYYEAANEYGLAIAGLNFPKNCVYSDPKPDKLNLTPFELPSYLLGNYKSIEELRPILKDIVITNIWFNENMPLSPLHFMICDKNECIVLEQTKDGLRVYQNDVGVMTNNPTFDLQLDNLEKYDNLSNLFKESLDSKYECVGLGALGLPGDFSSQSRFVKTCFLRKFVKENDEESKNVANFFHILDSVSMIEGTIKTKSNNNDITFYSSCFNLDLGLYYYKTYNNNQISCLKMTENNKNTTKLTRFPLKNEQDINYLN